MKTIIWFVTDNNPAMPQISIIQKLHHLNCLAKLIMYQTAVALPKVKYKKSAISAVVKTAGVWLNEHRIMIDHYTRRLKMLYEMKTFGCAQECALQSSVTNWFSSAKMIQRITTKLHTKTNVKITK